MKVLLKFKNLLFRESLFLKAKIIIIFSFAFCLIAFPQSEKSKWAKSEYVFSKKEINEKRDYSLFGSPFSISLKLLLDVYWFSFSDPSGDVCPYSPSCSHFFLESVQKTNIFHGGLMFLDRFTRDMNIFNRLEKYSLAKNGKLYDPISNYLIISDSVVYIPPVFLNK